MAEVDWVRKSELASLLKACRSRMAPLVADGRAEGLRQEDAAALVDLSARRYGGFERGAFVPSRALVDRVAAALEMTEAERSALHVLATSQDPPRPVDARQRAAVPPGLTLRTMVDHLLPHPACLTDELWTIQHHNAAMDEWAGGWYGRQPPGDRNMVMYLFSAGAADIVPDLKALREVSIAALRYQFVRNLSSPGASRLIARIQAVPEAAELWARNHVVIPPHEYALQLRHPRYGLVSAGVSFAPIRPQVWQYVSVLSGACGLTVR